MRKKKCIICDLLFHAGKFSKLLISEFPVSVKKGNRQRSHLLWPTNASVSHKPKILCKQSWIKESCKTSL